MSTDLAQLGFDVDSMPVKTATDRVREFGQQGKRASDEVTKSTSRVRDEYGRFVPAAKKAKRATDQFTASKRRATDMMDLAIKKLVGLAAGYVSLKAIGSSVMMAREFNAAIAETSTLIEGTPEQLQELTASARELSRTYGGDSVEQVRAFYQALSAGAGTVTQATQVLDQANRLAIGGATDVTTGVDGLTTAMNAYRASGLTAAEASDAMFIAMRAGKTTIGELSGSLGQIVPLSSSMGVSFEEVTGAIAALTTQGLSTASATTGLRQAMASVLTPTSQARDMAESLGIEFNATALRAQGLEGFLKSVVVATNGNQEAMGKLFGSVEALGAVLAFSGGAGETFTSIMEDMANKAGATDDAFTKMSLSLDQRWSVATAKARDLALGVGQVLLAIVVPAFEAAVAVGQFFADNMDVISVALAFLAGSQIPILVTSLATLATTFTAAGGASIMLGRSIAFLNTMLSMAGGPIGVILGLVAAAAAGMYYFSAGSEQAATSMDGAQTASRELSIELGLLSGRGLPETTAKTVDLANANLALADTAYGAAHAQLELARANMQAAFTQRSVEAAFNPGTIVAGQEAYERAQRALLESATALNAAQADLNARIAEGNAVKIEATEVMTTLEASEAAAAAAAARLAAQAGGAGTAVKKVGEEAEKTADVMNGPLTSALDSVEKVFEDLFSGAIDGFDNLVKQMLNAFKTMLAQMAAAAIMNPIRLSMGVGGNATGMAASALGGLGGGGGMLGGLGAAGGALLGGFGSGLAVAGNGLLAGGLGGAATASLGAITGGIGMGGLAGFATAAGAAMPWIAAGAALVSFFSTKTKTIDEGIRATVGVEEAMFETYKRVEKSRFWGLSKSRSTRATAMTDDQSRPLEEAVDLVRQSVVSSAKALGIGVDQFDGFTHKFNLSLRKLNDQQKQEAIEQELMRVGDAMAGMVDGLQQYADQGESTMQTLQRLGTSLTVVNDVFRDLGFAAYDVSVAGGAAASAFVDLFGTVEGFASASAAYYDQFYSNEEKLLNATARLRENLNDLGVSFVPATREAFRELVDTAMAGGDSDLAAQLIKLSPLFASVVDSTGEQATALGRVVDLFRDPLRLDSSRFDNRFDATMNAAEERRVQVQREADNAQLTELKLMRLALEQLRKEQRDARLYGVEA